VKLLHTLRLISITSPLKRLKKRGEVAGVSQSRRVMQRAQRPWHAGWNTFKGAKQISLVEITSGTLAFVHNGDVICFSFWKTAFYTLRSFVTIVTAVYHFILLQKNNIFLP